MAVKLKAVQRVNPQDVTAPQKFYAKAVGDGGYAKRMEQTLE